MRYAVWFVRLIYAAWMVPAGLNHFIRLYPQPGGANPLSDGVFTALLDSGMFTLVKATELAAGIMVLLGIRLPLALVAVLPVSFTVWYWDTELQGWFTPSAVYGWGVLGCNLFLLYACRAHYARMFDGFDAPQLFGADGALLDGLRWLLGLVLLVTGIAWFLPMAVPFVPPMEWADPMAARLAGSFEASGLMAVGKFLHVAAGLALMLNRATPLALAAVLPVNVCGTFLAVLLEREVLGAALAMALLALNGVLMLAHLPAYRAMLGQGALADGEEATAGANYDSVFAHPHGPGIALQAVAPAILALIAAAAFYWWIVPGLNSITGLVVLAWPALVLGLKALRGHAGRAPAG